MFPLERNGDLLRVGEIRPLERVEVSSPPGAKALSLNCAISARLKPRPFEAQLLRQRTSDSADENVTLGPTLRVRPPVTEVTSISMILEYSFLQMFPKAERNVFGVPVF
jgi:hypothetical protein